MGSSVKIDRSHVTLATEVERLYWETKLGAPRERLWEAIDAVGDEPGAVRAWLETHGRRAAPGRQGGRDGQTCA